MLIFLPSPIAANILEILILAFYVGSGLYEIETDYFLKVLFKPGIFGYHGRYRGYGQVGHRVRGCLAFVNQCLSLVDDVRQKNSCKARNWLIPGLIMLKAAFKEC